MKNPERYLLNKPEHPIKTLLYLSKRRVEVYILLSLIFLVFHSRAFIKQNYVNQYLPHVPHQELIGSGLSVLEPLNNLIKNQPRIGQSLTWAFLGFIFYVAIWFIVNFLVSILNDFIGYRFVHPNSFKGSGYWLSVAGSKIPLLMLIPATIIFVLSSIGLLNNLGDLFIESLSVKLSTWSAISKLSLSVLGVVLIVYTYGILVKLLVRSWDVFES